MKGQGRGFASLSPERLREVSRAGYDAVVEYYGVAGRPWTRATAREAGAKGNAARRAAVSPPEVRGRGGSNP